MSTNYRARPTAGPITAALRKLLRKRSAISGRISTRRLNLDRNAFLSRVTSALYGVSPAEDLSVRSPQDWGRRGPKAAVDDSVPDLVDRFVIEAEAVGTRVI